MSVKKLVAAAPVAAAPLPGFSLDAPTPNPSGRALAITYSTRNAGPVAVRVYDVQGRLVKELATGFHATGRHTAAWDGTDALGNRVPTGTYICRLECEAGTATRAVVLVR